MHEFQTTENIDANSELCIQFLSRYMDMTSSLLRDREKNEETFNESCEFSAKLRGTLEQILQTYLNDNQDLKLKNTAL